MKRKRVDGQEDELADEFKPNLRDALTLRDSLAKYSPRKVNGRTQYPFHQYCLEKNVIRLDDFGGAIITNVSEFHRLNELNNLREWKADKDLEAVFQQFPEEKEIHQTKIALIIKEIKEMLTRKKVEV